jgi:hypothetical protein
MLVCYNKETVALYKKAIDELMGEGVAIAIFSDVNVTVHTPVVTSVHFASRFTLVFRCFCAANRENTNYPQPSLSRC